MIWQIECPEHPHTPALYRTYRGAYKEICRRGKIINRRTKWGRRELMIEFKAWCGMVRMTYVISKGYIND